jgi:hypothetical protein
MRVLVSGSGQSLPVVPWIAVLDLDVTTTAQEGLYVVYLYSSDLSRIYLSMNQGATQHKNNALERGLAGVGAEQAALEELGTESKILIDCFYPSALHGMKLSIDLEAKHRFLPRGYEQGNVAAIEYASEELPDEKVLRSDLSRILSFYSACVEAKRDVLSHRPGVITTTPDSSRTRRRFQLKPPAFKPKSGEEYRASVEAHEQVRQRRHEDLLTSFHDWVDGPQLQAANNTHPCDMTVDSVADHWLVEAKTVGPNAEVVVREAIGQLFAYRHFCYRDIDRPDPHLVALFSEPIGDAFVNLIASLGIEAIWRDQGEWHGRSPLSSSPSLHLEATRQARVVADAP